jgi:hypothetical protein
METSFPDMVGIVLLIAFYFLPTIVVVARGKTEARLGVLLLNWLLGWTVAGWLFAFAWACTGRTPRRKKYVRKIIGAANL